MAIGLDEQVGEVRQGERRDYFSCETLGLLLICFPEILVKMLKKENLFLLLQVVILYFLFFIFNDTNTKTGRVTVLF